MKKLRLFGQSDKTKIRSLNRQNNIEGWLLMIPMVFILYAFIWRPTVIGAGYSFFDMQGYTIRSFCGLENYVRVISHTQFLPILFNTIKYVFWSFVIGFLPPIFTAIMLNEIIHGQKLFRVLIYLPVVIPGIAAMLMWNFIYYPDSTGLLNVLLSKFGVEPYGWLNDPRFSIIGIIIFSTWKNYGSSMLLYFAAVQGISVELYEAAIIDGANPWKRFWHITRPSLDGLIILNVVRQIINVFQILQEPLAMTAGGPNGASASMSYQLFQYGFNSGGRATGQAMALGVIIFLILIVFTVFYFRVNKKIEDRY